jgi:hypothetical protein
VVKNVLMQHGKNINKFMMNIPQLKMTLNTQGHYVLIKLLLEEKFQKQFNAQIMLFIQKEYQKVKN